MAGPLSKAAQASGKSRGGTVTEEKPTRLRRGSPKPEPETPADTGPQVGQVAELPLADVILSRNVRGDELGDIDGLAASLKAEGLLQPIRVRVGLNGRYIVIAGARRLLAANKAGLKTITAFIAGDVSDSDAYVQGLVENVVRANLDPIATARAFETIIAETGMTQAKLARKVGWKSQSAVAHTLALLDLPTAMQDSVQSGELTAGAARTIARIEDPDVQAKVAAEAAKGKLSVRDVEARAKEVREAETVRQAKDIAEQERQDAERQSAVAILAVLAESSIASGSPKTVLVYHAGEAERLVGAGIHAVLFDPKTMTAGGNKRWDCDCDAIAVTGSQANGFAIIPACVSEEHQKTYVDAQKVALREAEVVNARKVTEAQRALAKSMKVDGNAALSIDGLRLALYSILTAEGRHRIAMSFVKRNGGEYDSTLTNTAAANTAETWSTILVLSDKDLVNELARSVSADIIPQGLFSMNGTAKSGAAVRLWAIETFGLDLVAEPLRPDSRSLPTFEVHSATAVVTDEVVEPEAEPVTA